jgi:hypothetical protein
MLSHVWATETLFGLLIIFINFQVVTTLNYNTVTQLTIITRQSFHSFRVFSLTESHTSNIAFNSHFTSSQADLLYFPGLRLAWMSMHSLRNCQPLIAWVALDVFKITPRQGPHINRCPSIVVGECLSRRCIAAITARTTQKTSYVIPSQLLHWRSDCCVATSNNIRNSIVPFVYSVVRCSRL